MNVYEAVAARKTIRDFDARPVDPQLIRKIIAAGLQAPTNNHMREWHFVLLQDRARRKALLDRVIRPVDREGSISIVDDWKLIDESQREMYIEAIPRQYSMLYNASVLVIPCFFQPDPLLKPANLSALNYFASIWCCIENILIAAAAEGIFGVTRIPFEEERSIMKQFMCIPPNYEIPCYLALGYPKAGARRTPQVEIDIEERIHGEEWG